MRAPADSAALMLDAAGRVTAVAIDRLGLPDAAVGRPLPELLGASARAQLSELLAAVGSDGMAVNWMVTPGPAVPVPVLFATAVACSAGKVGLLAARPEDLDRLHAAFAALRPDVAAEIAVRVPVVGEDPLRGVMEEVGRLNSELTANQRELARTNSRLARINAEMQHMLGVAAHDLRSPLGVISAYSEVLESVLADRLAPREYEMLESIRSATAFMRRLLDDTLDFAKIESGTLRLNRAETDVAALMRATVGLQQVVAEQAGKWLELDIPADLPSLSLDADKIRQVLDNLLANAIRYARDDGLIRVEACCTAEQVVIAVADDGCGIPEDQQTRLFQPFVQLRGQGGSGGAGLGLAICRRIAEAHGGWMSLESAAGAGATFRLHLPRA